MSQSQTKKFIITSVICFLTATYAFSEKQRIVTIGGAATEAVFALGHGDEVIATDLSSTYPPEVRDLPQVGYIRSISPEGILSMKPDLVVATESLGPPAAKDLLKKTGVEILWLPEPNSYQALEASINEVAETLDSENKANAVLAKVKSQIDQAQANSEKWSSPAPRVLFFMRPPNASSPGMAGGNGTRADELIRLAGGTNAANSITGFQPMSAESIIEMNPDIILVALSNGHGGTEASIVELQNLETLAPVAAIQNDAIHGVPLDDIAFGPRLGEAVERWNGLFALRNAD
ncbi:heme/hemin ABC transporter substrate-binding protein [Rubellicoccus peritrichatus]|uniref:ABC transporter substrate-binding protein n=1 Tax=Rubellicoccus peritrichatus TaxID=3080537 RepID=A0AAQ3LC24_9BACT|nr:ABC transporter substrate-binding protein [Puniceicoccus sp. CR14]WOO42641.1 ABC transporter substrate-binding protein [Puniceicoccus sp. CR14]